MVPRVQRTIAYRVPKARPSHIRPRNPIRSRSRLQAFFLSGLTVRFAGDRHLRDGAPHLRVSRTQPIPKLPREIQRRARTEFRDAASSVATSQWKIGETRRRHMRRAEKSAVSLRRIQSQRAYRTISQCAGNSMSKGTLPANAAKRLFSVADSPEIPSIVTNGAGQIFQAVRDDVVMCRPCW